MLDTPELLQIPNIWRLLEKVSRFKRQSPGPWAYEQQTLGFNYRMTDFQAALGISQLKRLEKIVSERNKQYIIYD